MAVITMLVLAACRNDVRYGQGSHRMTDGTLYEGQFRDDLPHGHGVFTAASGQKYEGQWAAGRREGWCQYSLSVEEVWAGEQGPRCSTAVRLANQACVRFHIAIRLATKRRQPQQCTMCSCYLSNLSTLAVSRVSGRWAKGRPQWVEPCPAPDMSTASDDTNGSPAGGSEAVNMARAAGRKARAAAAQAAAVGEQLHGAEASAQVRSNVVTALSIHPAHGTCLLRTRNDVILPSLPQAALRKSVREADVMAEAARKLQDITLSAASAAKLTDASKAASPRRSTAAI